MTRFVSMEYDKMRRNHMIIFCCIEKYCFPRSEFTDETIFCQAVFPKIKKVSISLSYNFLICFSLSFYQNKASLRPLSNVISPKVTVFKRGKHIAPHHCLPAYSLTILPHAFVSREQCNVLVPPLPLVDSPTKHIGHTPPPCLSRFLLEK